MERNPITESLAKNFREYLQDPSLNGGYKAEIPSPNLITYNVANLHFEVEFVEKYQCKLRITNGSKIEEQVSIPYNEFSKTPDWQIFLEGIFALTRQRLLHRE
ncbi:MAG: hypothetical protein V1889_00180 [archaeon]